MSLSLCSVNNANTGSIDCDVSRAVLKTLYIFNGEFTSGNYVDVDTFTAKMIANAKLARNNSDKVFPIPVPQEITDKSEANKEATFALGYKVIELEGRPSYEFQMIAGSVTAKNLRKFNGKTVRVLELDSNNNVWGCQTGTKFKGFQATLFFSGDKIGTGASGKPENRVVTCTVSILSNTEYKDSAVYMPVNVEQVDDIAGLIDCYMEVISSASNVWQIGVYVNTTQIGQRINVAEQFSSDIADASLFTATSGTASPYATSLAITSVAYNSTLKCLTFTFNSTAFGLLGAGDFIKLVPAAPNTLDANDVTGVEIDTLIFSADN